jgi:hypothetical protein
MFSTSDIVFYCLIYHFTLLLFARSNNQGELFYDSIPHPYFHFNKFYLSVIQEDIYCDTFKTFLIRLLSCPVTIAVIYGLR